MRTRAVLLVIAVASSAAIAQPAHPPLLVRGDAAAWQAVSASWERLGGLRSYRMKLVPAPGMQGAEKMTMVIEVVAPDRRRMVVDVEDSMTIETITVGQEFRRRLTLRGQLAQQAAQNPAMAGQIANQIGGGFFGSLSNIIAAVTNPLGFVANLAFSWIASRVTSRVASAGADDLRPGVWSCKRPGAGAPSSQGSSAPPSATEVTAVAAGESLVEGARTRVFDVTFSGQQSGQAWTSKMRVHVLDDRQVPRRIEMFDEQGTPAGFFDYTDLDAPITIDLPACPP